MRTAKALVAGLALAALTVVAQAQQGPGVVWPRDASKIGQAAAAASEKVEHRGLRK